MTRVQLLEYRQANRGRLAEFTDKLERQFEKTCKRLTIMFARKQREDCEAESWQITYDDLVDEEDLSLLPLCQPEVVAYGNRIKEVLEEELADYDVTLAMNGEGDLEVVFSLRPTSVPSSSSTST